MSPFVTLPLAAGLSAVPVAAGRLRALGSVSRGRWVSLGAGVSVAYVFVHVFPEMTERHAQLTAESAHAGTLAATLTDHAVFLAALVGFTAFYGLEQLVRRSRRRTAGAAIADAAETRTSERVFWVHVGSFTAYNGLVGYLLLHREESGVVGLVLYVAAMAVHFVVTDAGLRDHHRDAYRRVGRWLLAGGVLVGVGVGLVADVPPSALTLLFAGLAGGIVFNVVKEELPADPESRFWTFGAGLAGYTLVLLLVRVIR